MSIRCTSMILYTIKVKLEHHIFGTTLTNIHRMNINYIWVLMSYSTPYNAIFKTIIMKSKQNVCIKEKNTIK